MARRCGRSRLHMVLAADLHLRCGDLCRLMEVRVKACTCTVSCCRTPEKDLTCAILLSCLYSLHGLQSCTVGRDGCAQLMALRRPRVCSSNPCTGAAAAAAAAAARWSAGIGRGCGCAKAAHGLIACAADGAGALFSRWLFFAAESCGRRCQDCRCTACRSCVHANLSNLHGYKENRVLNMVCLVICPQKLFAAERISALAEKRRMREIDANAHQACCWILRWHSPLLLLLEFLIVN